MKRVLDGEWLFRADSSRTGIEEKWYQETADRSSWQRVRVPRFWEGYPGLANYDGWGWYARTFRIENITEPLSLHFAGVDDDAVVWVNGMEVGSHEGYSDPFALDVGKALKAGDNLIVVLVKDYAGGGGIYKPVTLIETNKLDELLKSPFFGTPARQSADWVKDACIYSVYLRSFSKEGTFAGLERRVEELKQMGVTVLWLLPIHPIGKKHRKGRLGSPYSVQDYYAVNPEFGTLADFKRLLATVHKHGMKLIIDLVANHTSWDSKLIQEHPEWFTRDERGNIVSPNSDWTDVADLDYSKPELRRYMIDMMIWWVKDVGIDGFRCDVAELVPTDFWEQARRELDAIKPVMMLSEGSIPEHHAFAFDVTYSWNVYDALDVLLKGKRPVNLLDQILEIERLQFPVGALRMRFASNHDKNAWDAPAVLKFGLDGAKLAAVLVGTLPGVPMLYTGDEVANDRRLDLFDKVDVDWSKPREVGEVYSTIFHLRKRHKALTEGKMIRLEAKATKDVYAFARVAGEDVVIVVLNFGREAHFTAVSVPVQKVFGSSRTVLLRDVFNGQEAELSSRTGEQIIVALEPRAYRVFVQEK
ncbi:MAG TPA: alpha-amylase family glycosyl hydrolase [Bacteroidota bacterium]|nr:alpha-amylase family glycosyl hydrolase [Bacteroidota bacterium]